MSFLTIRASSVEYGGSQIVNGAKQYALSLELTPFEFNLMTTQQKKDGTENLCVIDDDGYTYELVNVIVEDKSYIDNNRNIRLVVSCSFFQSDMYVPPPLKMW